MHACSSRAFLISASAGLCLAVASGVRAQTWSEIGDAGELPATAQTAAGAGPLLAIFGDIGGASDIDMYQLEICDFANFSASTVGQATLDTQLFLFSAAGLGIASNDDEVVGTSFQSTITSQFVPNNGLYYLAISLFNRDPISSGGLIFSPPLPRSEVNANGPGAGSPISGWQSTTTGTGPYGISLTGACFVDATTPGACCLPTGQCVASTIGDCAAAGGNFAGANSTCATANCPPPGACCFSDGTCAQRTSAACGQVAGATWLGANTSCGAACQAISFLSLPLTYNWNGMVSATVEQGPDNFNNPDGYRSIADRGLLLSGSGNSIDAGPILGHNGMPYTINTQSLALDIVHLGDRRTVANAARNWGTGGNNALQPSWLLENDQTTPQVSSLSAVNATLTSQSSIGVLYQISDSGGRFDCVLTFTDNSSATLTLRAPDWFNVQTPPAPQPGSGLIVQRQLGVYASTQDTDNANNTTNNLNVVEAVTTVQRLIADGFGDFSGKRLASITFQNPVSNANYPNSTPATGSGIAIIAASLSYPGGGPACYANCDGSTTPPILNVADFGCFLGKFAAGDPYANCDGSTTPPVLNVADFGCFLGKFAAGCR